MRVNILKALGADIGIFGESVFAKVFPEAARGESVAMVVEGIYSTRMNPPATSLPRESTDGIVSRHISTDWPIHKSWFVPAVDMGEPRVFVKPPKKLVRYIGRDVQGTYSYLLRIGLEELKNLALHGSKPTYLSGWEMFRDVELEIASKLVKQLDTPQFAALAIETLREVDFLMCRDGVIYHVEVKTTLSPTDHKLRKKKILLEKRQRVLEKLGMRPALATVVPRENWEVDVEIYT